MKKFVVILTILALALSIAACGDSSTPPTNAPAAQTTQAQGAQATTTTAPAVAETTKAPEAKGDQIVIGTPIVFDKFTVTITKLSIVKDWDDKPVLKINYDWENTGDESVMASFTFLIKGFQDGVETDDTSISDEIDLGLGQKEVRPGGKVSAEDSVGIADMAKPLELELTELFSFSDGAYTMVIEDLSALK